MTSPIRFVIVQSISEDLLCEWYCLFWDLKSNDSPVNMNENSAALLKIIFCRRVDKKRLTRGHTALLTWHRLNDKCSVVEGGDGSFETTEGVGE